MHLRAPKKDLKHFCADVFAQRYALARLVLVACAWVWLPSPAMAQASPIAQPSNLAEPTTSPVQEGAMTREEILKTFEREARAAYQIAQESCQGLNGQEKTICLASARLQFDEDMRYAKQRADMGH
jgi:hypothetical protein